MGREEGKREQAERSLGGDIRSVGMPAPEG